MPTGIDGGPLGSAGPESLKVSGVGRRVGGQQTHNRSALATRVHRIRGRHLRPRVVVAVVVAATAAGGYVGLTSSMAAPRVAGGSTSRVGLSSAGGSATTGSDLMAPDAIACPMLPSVTNAVGGAENVGSATHLFTRTTTGGVTIRAYRLPQTSPCGCGPIANATSTSPVGGSTSKTTASGAQALPGDSLATAPVSIELSDATAVGQGVLFDAMGTTATTPNATTEPTAAISDAFGVVEGTPVWWIAVSVGPEVSNAQMTFADGSTDQMSPVDGVVVLADPIDPSVASSGDGPYDVRGTLRLLDSSGAVITSVTFPEPTPPPVPVPFNAPGSPPAPGHGTTPSTLLPIVASPPTSNDAMTACPEMTTPARAAAG